MASAEVGDDVYGDDPTVKRLETLGARILGKEAALFVPSGTFGNQLALFTWCRRGTEVVIGEESHIVFHEAGAASVIAGVQLRHVSAPDGVLKPDDLLKRLRKQDLHSPATSLICLENAHSSGRVVSLRDMDAVKTIAAEWGLPVHLDGARIFNAAAVLGCTAADIAARADSIMFCLSKGLCAPVGSLLAGTAYFVEAARMKRKVMGGGMRQAGILAAAGIIALAEHPPLLVADHERAKKLAQGLSEIKGIQIDVGAVQTNIIFFRRNTAAANVVESFAKRGILINPPDRGTFRFVTHYWIGAKELDVILAAAAEVFAGADASEAGAAGADNP
jgi:threonine aldolase